MFQINVTVDTTQFSRQVDAQVAEELVPYLANVVDQLADGAIAALVEAQAAVIDRPKPFTQNGWRKGKPKPGPGGSVVTDVHLLPIQAEYLTYVIDGGVRRAGDYATTSQGPLVPGRDAKRDAYGNLPRGYVQRMMRDPDVAWVHLGQGHLPALIRHKRGKPVEILAVIVEQTVHRSRLDIHDIVGASVTQTARRIIAGA